ncbi:MAG: hypothetical protein ACPG4Z_08115 [Chitinophagales bacterium]
MKALSNYNRKDWIEFIPLMILSIISIYSVIKVIFSDYIFSLPQQIGIPILSICLFLFFISRSVYKYVTGLILFVSTFNLIGFNATNIVMNFSFFPFPIQIDAFFVSLIFGYIHRQDILAFLKKSIHEKQKEQNNKIATFRYHFRNLNTNQLLEKINDKTIVGDAKTAALELLNEKKEKS